MLVNVVNFYLLYVYFISFYFIALCFYLYSKVFRHFLFKRLCIWCQAVWRRGWTFFTSQSVTRCRHWTLSGTL